MTRTRAKFNPACRHNVSMCPDGKRCSVLLHRDLSLVRNEFGFLDVIVDNERVTVPLDRLAAALRTLGGFRKAWAQMTVLAKRGKAA